MTTTPRLRTLLPDVTVQRVMWSADSCSPIEVTLLPRHDGGEVALVAAPELGAVLPDRIFERIGERDRRGRDDVRVGAHRRPLERAVGRLDGDPSPCPRGCAGVEDPDLVVIQMDRVENRVERAERLADGSRIDVLVAPLHLRDGGAVDATLVGERRSADVGLIVIRGLVRDLGDRSGQLRQAGEVAAAGRLQGEVGLQGEVREEAYEVRVTAALAIAVDRRLDMA